MYHTNRRECTCGRDEQHLSKDVEVVVGEMDVTDELLQPILANKNT